MTETEENINGATITQEEQGQEDYKNHQQDSIEQKLEETSTPTATADLQTREEQAKSRKRSRTTIIIQIAASRHTAEKQCARDETNEEERTCQPRHHTKKTDGNKEQEQGLRRKRTTWETLG